MDCGCYEVIERIRNAYETDSYRFDVPSIC